jgi:hypothetical protein
VRRTIADSIKLELKNATRIMDQEDFRTRAERCRRLAREVSDTHMRLSLEALADEYEARLGDDDENPGFTPRTRH